MTVIEPSMPGPAAMPQQVAGRDAVEAQLCDIWQSVLKLDRVAIDDDFFDLNGDSLTGIHIIAETERLFGIELELADFFSAPTVASMATVVRAGTAGRRPEPLVRLQGGDGGTPVYVFHPLPGTVLGYAAFARALGADVPVWGLQSLGFEPGEAPLHSLEAMAREYLARMRTVHPGGPWHLVGYSMGGYLALEVARQLTRLAEPVGVVGLLDTSAPVGIDRRSPDEIRANAIRNVARRVLGVEVEAAALRGRTPAEQVQELLDRGVAAATLPADYDVDRLHRMLEVRLRNRLALSDYRPEPYPSSVLLFRAIEPWDQAPVEGPDLGWTGWLAGMEVRDVVADHLAMLEPHIVPAIATVIRGRVRS